MRRALLDVNVLIALLDEAHIHHALASSWLDRELQHGWASCPITQNGCVRIMSQPVYPGHFSAVQVAERLAEAANSPAHQFWPADVSLLENSGINWSHVLGHRQVTDAYLLALAIQHGGRFVTFDQRIVPQAVIGATRNDLLILQ